MITDDALERFCVYSNCSSLGLFKNLLQSICSIHSRTRRLVRMFSLCAMYAIEFHGEIHRSKLLDIVSDLKILIEPYHEGRDNFFEIELGGILDSNGDLTHYGTFVFNAVRSRILSVLDRRDEIDVIIQASSMNWRIGRMMQLDLNILRLGVHEIMFVRRYPPRTIINDAVELAKVYGSEHTRNFVNGILQQVCTDNGVTM